MNGIATTARRTNTRLTAITTIDTHELVKDLKSAGFTDQQAEAATRPVKQAQQIDFSDLATKTDLAASGARLDNIESRLGNFATKADLADTKTELIKRVFTIAVGQGAVIVALLKLLPGAHL